MASAADQPTSPLGSLTKTSAKTQDFLVRVFKPRAIKYSYKSRRNGQQIDAVRFTCILIGTDSDHYCEANFKGSAAEVEAAHKKFLALTAWKLSKVGLDSQHQDAFVHTSVRVVVDLKRTQCTPVLQSTPEETSLASAPTPQLTVADMMNIKSRRCFDVMAVVHSVSDTRTPAGHPPVASVHLVDGTQTSNSKTAEAVVSVWGKDNIEFCRSRKGQPLLFLNVAAKFEGRLELNLSQDRVVDSASSCPRLTQLTELAAQDDFAKDREQLTTAHATTWDPDNASQVLTGEALLSCCAFLAMASEDPTATLPQLLQVNGMRLEEPEPADSVVESKGERVFFTTTARDFSGSCKVGVSQAAAFALSGIETMSEFQKIHEERAISFPPLSNCRIIRRVRQVSAKEGDDAPERTYVNTTVVAASPLQMSHAPNTSYHIVLDILKQCRESQDAMLAAHLSEIRHCPFYGMRVEYPPAGSKGDASQLARNCRLALALVRTTQKSRCLSTAGGFVVSTPGVTDASGDESSHAVTIHGYCSIDKLLNFKMDPPNRAKHRVCLLLISGCSKDGITVHSVTHIDEAAAPEAQYFITKLRTLGMRTELQHSGDHKRMNEWSTTPDSAKKCRVLEGHPSGESLK